MAGKPAVLPEVYNGDGEWDEWKEHFGNVAAVNAWDDEAKFRWLKVRLTGRAQRAFQQLSDDKKADYETAVRSLGERFDPPSKKERYVAEFQAYQRKPNEGWAEVAEDLKLLADKAYKSLSNEARELLALNRYLQLLSDQQISFAVRQSKPKNLDEAVTATLEMESFKKVPAKVASAMVSNTDKQQVPQATDEMIATVKPTENSELMSTMKQLIEKLSSLELAQKQLEKERGRERERRSGRPRSSVRCWKCQELGHIARFCREQGN